MKIFITGGAGFIGSAFVRLILSNNEEFDHIEGVTVVDSLTYSGNLNNLKNFLNDSRLRIEVGSINDSDLLRDLIPGHDLVVNFAAESHVDRSITDPSVFMETNIIGAHNVFYQSLAALVPRVVHVSTDEVYGSTKEFGFTEESLLQPNSPYAASKASSDLIARSFFVTHRLPIIVTRSSNNYGPFQFPEKLIPLAITNILRNKKIPVYGNGLNQREWIHVDDHCRAILKVAASGEVGEIYNIGGRNQLSNIDLVERILSIMGKDSSYREFVEDRKGHDFRYAIDSSKIQSLGFRESIDFEAGIEKVVRWYVDNPKWWTPLLPED
jgi:dTDP-glucose 4,6-dehydratase